MRSLQFIASRVRPSPAALVALGYVAAVTLPVLVVLVVARLSLPPFVFEHAIVLLVVGCAVRLGMRPALVTAVVAVAADNVLLREPAGQPTIGGIRDVLDLVLFVTVAVIVGWIVASARHHRMRAERAAGRERRAREDRDRLIATISHDLAAPLTAIRGSIQFAQRFGPDARLDITRVFERLDTAASRATSLVETLRDTQAIENGLLSLNMTTADLREVVLPVVQMFDRMSERHPVVVTVPDRPPILRADTSRLQRVLENLLANAIKYSPSGGAVEVAVAIEDGEAVVHVRDHGIGISTEALPHVFEPAFRAPEAVAAAPGMGLGLSIAAEIVHRHGGTIEARRAEPQGTLVSLRLPLLRGDGGQAGPPPVDGGAAMIAPVAGGRERAAANDRP